MNRANLSVFFQRVNLWIAQGFGSGLSPKAPGTCGSIAAIPLIWACSQSSFMLYTLIIFIGSIAGVFICDIAAKNLGEHDAPSIVWDEIIGMFITFWFVPVTTLTLVMGFLLFRFFDIVKPYPISFLDQSVEGGLGIMLDDILAGLFSAILLGLAWQFL